MVFTTGSARNDAMSLLPTRPLTAFVVAGTLLALPGCSDDPVVDRTPPSSTTTPGASPLDRPGSHDASVLVHFTITGDGSGPDPAVDALAELEERLVDAIEPTGIGELTGDEFGEGTVTISLYGPDLDRLWAKVQPILETYDARPAYAELRDGGPDQPAQRVDLGPVPTRPTTTQAR